MLFTLMTVLIYSSVNDFNLIEFINNESNNDDVEEIIPVATEESDFFEENRNSDLEFLSVDMDKSDYFEENMIVEDGNNPDNISETSSNILYSQISHAEIIKNDLEDMRSNIENPDIFECSERILKELMSRNINDFINNSYCEEQIKSSESENIENCYISTDIHCDKGNVQENDDFESYVNYINDNNYNLNDIQIFDSKETWVEVIPTSKENEKNNEILSRSENDSVNASQNMKTTEIICTKNKKDLSEIHSLREKKINGKIEYTLNLGFQNLSNIQVITFKDIQHVDLDHNNLVHIPNEIFNLHSLKSLSLENNKIKNISEINTNLIYLKCSNNKIDSFHITENDLIYLIMDKNEIREFHLNFNFYKEIKTLDLSKNKITKFTIEHPDKSKLMRLDLSDNEIKKIEENIKYLNLELLDLRNNKLNSKSANIIISMKNLKYLDLKGNNIECLRTIESKTLLFLNISKNPVVILHKNFFDMPCIKHIFMSGLTISLFPSLRKSMDNLNVLDMSYTEIITLPYVHDSLVNLEFLNLSNCRLEYFPEGINIKKLKKLNLSNNDLKNLPAKFRELKDKQIVLDLRNNPLDYFSDKRKLGVLDLLEIFYNKILLDDKIYEEVRNLPFKSIYSQRPNFEIFKFEQLNKVVMKNEYCLHYLYPLLNSDDQGIKNKVMAILAFAEKIRTSDFLLFEFLFEKVGKMIESSEDINNVVNKIYLYLTERYSSKIYKFLKETVDEYKKLILKKSIIKIYDSEQNYNYWVFKLKDILLYNQEKVYFNEDDSLFYDKNVILNCFINNINLEEFIKIIKNKIKGDMPIFRSYSLMIKFIRKSGLYKKHKKSGEININNISDDDIRMLLCMFQFSY